VDIVQSLKWVRGEHHSLRWRPGQITIFGQSGGGVSGHAARDARRQGLVHRAIIESGATITLVEQAQASRVAENLVEGTWTEPERSAQTAEFPRGTHHGALFAVMRR